MSPLQLVRLRVLVNLNEVVHEGRFEKRPPIPRQAAAEDLLWRQRCPEGRPGKDRSKEPLGFFRADAPQDPKEFPAGIGQHLAITPAMGVQPEEVTTPPRRQQRRLLFRSQLVQLLGLLGEDGLDRGVLEAALPVTLQAHTASEARNNSCPQPFSTAAAFV